MTDRKEFPIDSISALSVIPADFPPVIELKSTNATSDEKFIWGTSTQIAWDLRQADSQGDKEAVESILNVLSKKPRMEFYVIYQFLSDSYENEQELRHEGINLNPLTERLHNFAFETFKKGLETTTDPDELTMFKNVAARASEWANERGYGSTYLRGDEIKSLFNILKKRQTESGDLFLNSKKGEQIMKEIAGPINHIKTETLQ